MYIKINHVSMYELKVMLICECVSCWCTGTVTRCHYKQYTANTPHTAHTHIIAHWRISDQLLTQGFMGSERLRVRRL